MYLGLAANILGINGGTKLALYAHTRTLSIDSDFDVFCFDKQSNVANMGLISNMWLVWLIVWGRTWQNCGGGIDQEGARLFPHPVVIAISYTFQRKV